MSQINLIGKRFAFCEVCKTCLGEYRRYCAENHLKKYPNHDDFVVITIKDPLSMKNSDQWFKSHGITPDYIIRRNLTSIRSDEDFTEPVFGFCPFCG